MGDKSTIQWTDATWNPVTGCDKVSPGCAHCYAETNAKRLWPSTYPPVACDVNDPRTAVRDAKRVELFGTVGQPGLRFREFTDVQCHEDRLLAPLRWRKPRQVFVNSMSDLFHEDVSDTFIDKVFAVMALAPKHTFQILTKRPERMRQYMSNTKGAEGVIGRVNASARDIPKGSWWRGEHTSWPWANVWLGVSVENKYWRSRIDDLRRTPAAVRFVSFEPLLEDVSEGLDLRGIDWAIWGGESGPSARHCALEWIERGVDVCRRDGTAPFVKQLGAYVVSEARTAPRDFWGAVAPPRDPVTGEHFAWRAELRDQKGGDFSTFPAKLQIREYPTIRTEGTT